MKACVASVALAIQAVIKLAFFAGQRRLSGLTTLSLVIRFETETQHAMPSIQEQFRQLMKKIKPDIALLF